MFMITNMIETCMGKLILNRLVGNNYPEIRDGLWEVLTLGSNCLELFSEHLLSKLLLKLS